jgi:hypothetical protein
MPKSSISGRASQHYACLSVSFTIERDYLPEVDAYMSRFLSGLAKAGSDERQRLGHARSRDNGRLGAIEYRARKNIAYAPFQNGKQETFWNGIEGRLLPMLEGVADLTLDQLNQVTLAWLEMEYNRSVHTELGEAPLQRYLHGMSESIGKHCRAS